jgi:precorrin-4/cobalt-precorrin-4 C11-methyltransferase
MVHFVGAGPGAEDLITVRGAALIRKADQIIYAGSLVNPDLFREKKVSCAVYDSSRMTLEEVLQLMESGEQDGKMTVRLHTGDPCIYGAIREQMDALDRLGIPYDYVPGVSSFCGAAAALNLEYTLPGVTQSVILTRAAGRTEVPERESIRSFAVHGATMVLFLSAGLVRDVCRELLEGGYRGDTPAAVVKRASWPDEEAYVCTVATLAETCERHGITKTALLIVGEAAGRAGGERSRLYDPSFSTGYRKGEESREG